MQEEYGVARDDLQLVSHSMLQFPVLFPDPYSTEPTSLEGKFALLKPHFSFFHSTSAPTRVPHDICDGDLLQSAPPPESNLAISRDTERRISEGRPYSIGHSSKSCIGGSKLPHYPTQLFHAHIHRRRKTAEWP